MKNILIIGAGKGIGLACAWKLRENNLITVSRHETPELAALNTKFIPLDVVKDSLETLEVPEVLHGLIYCPGSIVLKPFQRLTEDDYRADFEQNFIGAVKVIHKCLSALKKADGSSIVLFSTVAAKLGIPFHTSISASKSAIEGLAKSLAAEVALQKVRVNAIAPSLTDTSLSAALLSTEQKREAADKSHPLQRVGTPKDIAALATFLMSDESSWMTGRVIGLDGGMGSIKS